MSHPGTSGPPTRRMQIAIVIGLCGLGIGVVAHLTGIAALGLAAGVAALVGPMVVLGPSRPMSEPPTPERGPDPDAAPLTPSRADPFEGDSGLLTSDYFDIAVTNRIQAARRFLKPIAVVRLRIAVPLPEAVDAVTDAVVATLRECDTACHLGGDTIGLVLEDTTETGAVWAVERVRRVLLDVAPNTRVQAGIACYPAHAMEPDEVLAHADAALERAAEWPQDRIEVAVVDY